MANNVIGTALRPCSHDPMTGFFRTGCCETGTDDRGLHLVCCLMDERFLAYSREVGNDLSTPRPEFGFPGLQPGDRWCVCMQRWLQAYEAGWAPKVVLEATHISALEYVDLAILRGHAVSLM
jgi:hypothetical protein